MVTAVTVTVNPDIAYAVPDAVTSTVFTHLILMKTLGSRHHSHFIDEEN